VKAPTWPMRVWSNEWTTLIAGAQLTLILRRRSIVRLIDVS